MKIFTPIHLTAALTAALLLTSTALYSTDRHDGILDAFRTTYGAITGAGIVISTNDELVRVTVMGIDGSPALCQTFAGADSVTVPDTNFNVITYSCGSGVPQ